MEWINIYIPGTSFVLGCNPKLIILSGITTHKTHWYVWNVAIWRDEVAKNLETGAGVISASSSSTHCWNRKASRKLIPSSDQTVVVYGCAMKGNNRWENLPLSDFPVWWRSWVTEQSAKIRKEASYDYDCCGAWFPSHSSRLTFTHCRPVFIQVRQWEKNKISWSLRSFLSPDMAVRCNCDTWKRIAYNNIRIYNFSLNFFRLCDNPHWGYGYEWVRLDVKNVEKA